MDEQRLERSASGVTRKILSGHRRSEFRLWRKPEFAVPARGAGRPRPGGALGRGGSTRPPAAVPAGGRTTRRTARRTACRRACRRVTRGACGHGGRAAAHAVAEGTVPRAAGRPPASVRGRGGRSKIAAGGPRESREAAAPPSGCALRGGGTAGGRGTHAETLCAAVVHVPAERVRPAPGLLRSGVPQPAGRRRLLIRPGGRRGRGHPHDAVPHRWHRPRTAPHRTGGTGPAGDPRRPLAPPMHGPGEEQG